MLYLWRGCVCTESYRIQQVDRRGGPTFTLFTGESACLLRIGQLAGAASSAQMRDRPQRGAALQFQTGMIIHPLSALLPF